MNHTALAYKKTLCQTPSKNTHPVKNVCSLFFARRHFTICDHDAKKMGVLSKKE